MAEIGGDSADNLMHDGNVDDVRGTDSASEFDGCVSGDPANGGNFDDGYEIFRQELESEKKGREKERNEFLAREQRANQTIDQLKAEMAKNEQAMVAMEERLKAEKVAALDTQRDRMQGERIQAEKEKEEQRLRETEALQQEVDHLHEKLRGTNKANRREIERRVQEMTAANKEEVRSRVGEVEERLKSLHDEERRRLEDRYKERDEKYKDEVKKLTEAKEELESILRRKIEVSPNDTLRRALESFINREKKAEEKLERQKTKYEEEIQQLKNDLKESKGSQNDKMREKYDGEIRDLEQEKKGLEAAIDGMKKHQQTEREEFEGRQKSRLQKLHQAKARISDLERSLEATNATCQQLTEKVSDVKAELENEKTAAMKRAETTERQHEQSAKDLRDQIVDVQQRLDTSETENTRLNKQILDEVKRAKEEIKEITGLHHREVTTLKDESTRALEVERERFKQEKDAAREYCEKLTQQKRELEGKIKNLEGQLVEKDKRIASLDERLVSLEKSSTCTLPKEKKPKRKYSFGSGKDRVEKSNTSLQEEKPTCTHDQQKSELEGKTTNLEGQLEGQQETIEGLEERLDSLEKSSTSPKEKKPNLFRRLSLPRNK